MSTKIVPIQPLDGIRCYGTADGLMEVWGLCNLQHPMDIPVSFYELEGTVGLWLKQEILGPEVVMHHTTGKELGHWTHDGHFVCTDLEARYAQYMAVTDDSIPN